MFRLKSPLEAENDAGVIVACQGRFGLLYRHNNRQITLCMEPGNEPSGKTTCDVFWPNSLQWDDGTPVAAAENALVEQHVIEALSVIGPKAIIIR